MAKIQQLTKEEQKKYKERFKKIHKLKYKERKNVFVENLDKQDFSPEVKKEKIKEFDYKYKDGHWENSLDKIIELKNAKKYFLTGEYLTTVMEDINLDFNKGEFVVILGPSGSGKTTLLNIMSGLENASSGDVIVANYNLSYLTDSKLTKFRSNYVSFVFQQYNLIPTLNVIENTKTGFQLRNKNKEEINIDELLKSLGLFEERYKYPYQLSGGQQQRVSIARAVSKNPSILFADEPTGALDETTGKQVLQILLDINKKYGTTIIMITHNIQIAGIGDKIVKFANGKITEIKENKERKNPQDISWA